MGLNEIWRKSKRSGQNSDCVEARTPDGETVEIRDSKDPHGGILQVEAAVWRGFLGDVKGGRFSGGARERP